MLSYPFTLQTFDFLGWITNSWNKTRLNTRVCWVHRCWLGSSATFFLLCPIKTLGISNCWAHYKRGIGNMLQSWLLLILTEFKTQSCKGYSVTFTISRVINFGIQELINWRGITKKHFAHRSAHRKPFFPSDDFKDIFMGSLSCLEKFIHIQDFGRSKGWIPGTCDAAVLCT